MMRHNTFGVIVIDAASDESMTKRINSADGARFSNHLHALALSPPSLSLAVFTKSGSFHSRSSSARGYVISWIVWWIFIPQIWSIRGSNVYSLSVLNFTFLYCRIFYWCYLCLWFLLILSVFMNKKSVVALTQLSLTLHCSRWIFYYQLYIHI